MELKSDDSYIFSSDDENSDDEDGPNIYMNKDLFIKRLLYKPLRR